jgi:hypothetical protein
MDHAILHGKPFGIPLIKMSIKIFECSLVDLLMLNITRTQITIDDNIFSLSETALQVAKIVWSMVFIGFKYTQASYSSHARIISWT